MLAFIFLYTCVKMHESYPFCLRDGGGVYKMKQGFLTKSHLVEKWNLFEIRKLDKINGNFFFNFGRKLNYVLIGTNFFYHTWR